MSEILIPNVKKLIIHKVSMEAIPKGGGVADGLKFLTDKERISKTVHAADQWVKDVIAAVRKAGEPNPFKDATDEEIAGEILRKVDEKRIDKLSKRNKP
jgi:hypothetical protein